MQHRGALAASERQRVSAVCFLFGCCVASLVWILCLPSSRPDLADEPPSFALDPASRFDGAPRQPVHRLPVELEAAPNPALAIRHQPGQSKARAPPPAAADDFQPVAAFAGARPGRVFRNGAHGMGYYKDPGPIRRALIEARAKVMAALATLAPHRPRTLGPPLGGQAAAATPAGAAGREPAVAAALGAAELADTAAQVAAAVRLARRRSEAREHKRRAAELARVGAAQRAIAEAALVRQQQADAEAAARPSHSVYANPPTRSRLRWGATLAPTGVVRPPYVVPNPAGEQPRAPADTFSVIVVSMNEKLLGKTVASLLNHPGHQLVNEVLIVDDSSDPPVSYSDLPADPRVKIVRSDTRLGLIAARHQGGEFSRGPFMAIIDGHCKPRPNWLVDVRARLNENYKRLVNMNGTRLGLAVDLVVAWSWCVVCVALFGIVCAVCVTSSPLHGRVSRPSWFCQRHHVGNVRSISSGPQGGLQLAPGSLVECRLECRANAQGGRPQGRGQPVGVANHDGDVCHVQKMVDAHSRHG